MKIFFCKKCRTLDYARGECSKCGSAEIDEANMEFLAFGSTAVQSAAMPIFIDRNPLCRKNWMQLVK